MAPAAPKRRARPRPRRQADGEAGQTSDVRSAREVFGALADEDFFSDAVQHLYFYEAVSDASVAALQAAIREANKTSVSPAGTGIINLAPKPIVLHVNSPGGDVAAASSMATIFTQSRTPICAMVDGCSASAATMISILAPYRVAATPHVFTLIHQFAGGVYGTRETWEFETKLWNRQADTMVRLVYKARTRLTDAQLADLMVRDLLLDTAFCLKHGILDRVLNLDNRARQRARGAMAEYSKLPLRVLMRKTNWNSFGLTCPESTFDGHANDGSSWQGALSKDNVVQLDALLGQSPDSLKPVMYYCTSRCQLAATDWMAVVARVQAFRVPVFSLTDTVVAIWQYVPALYCVRRYMYEHAIVVIDMIYTRQWGRRLPDIVRNTDAIVASLRSILKERTRLPAAILDSLAERRVLLTAQDCLKHGLCDELVPVGFAAP